MTATLETTGLRDDLMGRAAELVPALAARAQHAEQLRRMPDETVHDLRAAGLLRIANPTRYGGFGLDYDTALEVGAELGRGCGSTAWCYTVWSSHQWLLGMFPEQAQDDYFGSDPDVLSSSSFNPVGRVEPVDGGYLLSGHWDFSSGSDAGQWALLGGFEPQQGPGFFLVPRAEYAIEDTWFVSGLKATGSKDILIHEPTFVPRHRFLAIAALASAQTPGRLLHDRPTYQIAAWPVLSYTLVAPLLGMAQGALDAFEARLRTRVSPLGLKLAESQSVHVRLGHAWAELDAARAVMRQDLAELVQRGRSGESLSVLERARFRRNHAYLARLAVQAIDRVFEIAGGHALFEGSALQRFHRDAHAASHQVALNFDVYAEQFGRARMGLEFNDAFI